MKIILINPNNLEITNTKEFDNELKKICHIIETKEDEFIGEVGKFLGLNDEKNDFIADTEICCETYDKKVYEICHIDIQQNNITSRGENKLASNLTYLYRNIDGPVILLGYKINLNTKLPENIDVDFNILKDILVKKFLHKGIYIHYSNNMVEFNYHNNLNVFIEENKEIMQRLPDIDNLIRNGVCFEFSIFKYNMMIIAQIKDYENINKSMSLFLDKMLAKGNFIILHKISQNDYTDITIDEFKKMVYLYNNKILDENDTKEEKINDINVIKNKYIILDSKFNKIKAPNFENYINIEFDKNKNKYIKIFNEELKKEL
jgi:hypothetical protein